MTSDRVLLDPDRLAHLEEQRDFLLRSIEDLDREYAVGDVNDEDYFALRNDYVSRAASVTKQLEDRAELVSARKNPSGLLRSLGMATVVALVAGLAGVAVARFSGDRSATQELSGGIIESVGQQLSNCFVMIRTAEPVETLKCYDQILEDHPANVEAHTYRGWSLVLAGLPQFAWRDFVQATALDPAYPDARVFRAITLNQLCRPDEALSELAVFDDLNPPQDMVDLVEGQGLRASIGQLIQLRDSVPEVAGPPPPASLDTPDDLDQCTILLAAGVFDSLTEPPAQGANPTEITPTDN